MSQIKKKGKSISVNEKLKPAKFRNVVKAWW